MGPGDTVSIAGYELRLDRASEVVGPNYRDAVAHFSVTRNGRPITEMAPARRYYPVREMPTTEAAIKTFGLTQLYVTLGEAHEGKVVVRLFHKPLVLLIWIGALVARWGARFALCDRRCRGSACRRRSASPEGGALPAGLAGGRAREDRGRSPFPDGGGGWAGIGGQPVGAA